MLSGRREKARRVLDELEHMSADRYVDPYCLAVIMSGLGDGDATFEWLEKALAANSYNLVFLRLDQRFEKLHTDRRYSDLIKRAGLE
ncbi:MAG TPA: hypothetical protein VMZ26_16480 [Pyrinomonadaceae bacterium]|nr:hypothetical protein [Pyrinomonadaceae bacterium]